MGLTGKGGGWADRVTTTGYLSLMVGKAPHELMFEATARMLDESAWRRRVIEQVTPLSASHYEVQRSVQMELPLDVFGEETPPEGPVMVPIWWLRKLPLLRFSVDDSVGVPIPVVPRRDAAGVVGRWLQGRLTAAGLGDLFPISTLVAIAQASLGPWQQWGRTTSWDGVPTADYVHKSTGVMLHPRDAAALIEAGRATALGALEAAGLEDSVSRADWDTPAVCGVLLAGYADPEVESAEDLSSWITAHHAAIYALCSATQATDNAQQALRHLLRCGTHWPVLLPMKCEPGQQTIVKMREVLPSGDDSDVRSFVFETDASLAASYHLRVHTPDATIRIEGVHATKASGEEVGFPDSFEFARRTDELFTAYTGDPEGIARFTVKIDYRLQAAVVTPYWFAFLVAVPALFVALGNTSISPEDAAILSIPSSLVAAVVLVRDPPLTAAFLRRPRLALVALNVVLWTVTVWQTFGGRW